MQVCFYIDRDYAFENNKKIRQKVRLSRESDVSDIIVADVDADNSPDNPFGKPQLSPDSNITKLLNKRAFLVKHQSSHVDLYPERKSENAFITKNTLISDFDQVEDEEDD